LHHISIAHASLAELEIQLEIAARLQYLSSEQLAQSLKQITSLSKQLYSLRNALTRSNPGTQHPTPNTSL
jgi:four helix bundle protein